MEFYCTKTGAMRNLDKLFDIHAILKRGINDKKIHDAIKKDILTIFNKCGKKVYNKTENSFYKRIMDEDSDYCETKRSYRYYPNGLVYCVYFVTKNKNKIEEEYALSNDNGSYPTIVLKEYKVPVSFEKKIEANKEKIKEAQLKVISEQKKKEARRKAIADKKECQKNVEGKKTENPYLSFLDRIGYTSRNIRSNFIRYQLSKWYKGIKKPIVPKIFRDNPPLYKIMEKLNQINEDINLKTVIKDIHYEYQAKDDRADFICEWGSTSHILTKYSVIANLNTIRNEMDMLCKNYTYLFELIINGLGYSALFMHENGCIDVGEGNKNIKTYFMLVKDKKIFETIKIKKQNILYDSNIILNKPKYQNEIDVQLSDECCSHYRKMYKHGIYDGKNIIAFPYLSTICEAWPIFIEKVKECEYGEEWLERVGFIPPKNK